MAKRKKENFSEWYLELLEKAEVVDNRYNVKGFLVYLPTGMMLMRYIQRAIENGLDSTGHAPAMFPVVIPEGNLKKEKEHIKGFEAEVFWITHAGKNKLEERLCLRPTSETAMYPMYSLWIRSHTQLPFKLYQAGCVYRYETKMTKPLFRGREFYWIEAHTAQKDKKAAEEQVREDMEIYRKVAADCMCIPFLLLKKPEWDKFPGADASYGFEAMLPDGKALQIGTTHNLGDKFAKVFNIKYLDENGKKVFAHQTCFGPGISRVTGAMIAIHGDDKGLVIPPAVAPVQIVIVPIYTRETKAKVFEKCGEVLGWLREADFRVHLDNREGYTPGFKFNEWELKGIPVRIEIGPKDIEKKEVSIVRRDFLERITIPEEKIEEHLMEILDSITFQVQKRANELMRIEDAKDYKELKSDLEKGGFVRIDFCMQESCAEKLKAETGAEVRGTLFGKKEKAGDKCAVCGKTAKEKVYVAKAY